MKNYIRINVESDFFPIVSYDDGENAVILIFENYKTGTKIELYHGGLYFGRINLKKEAAEYEYKIPANYCFDGHIMHIRGCGREIHIIGNEKAFSNLKLTKRTDRIIVCEGNLKIRNQTGDGELKKKVVSKLPDKSEADANTIYFLAKKSEDKEDVYEEYVLINGAWERFSQREEKENIDFSSML